jgi:hypothetical protein
VQKYLALGRGAAGLFLSLVPDDMYCFCNAGAVGAILLTIKDDPIRGVRILLEYCESTLMSEQVRTELKETRLDRSDGGTVNMSKPDQEDPRKR